jgi:hypothetical protein
MGGIGGCSGRKARSWMTRRSFRFCQYPIEWNYFTADLVDHAAEDRTLVFRPRSRSKNSDHLVHRLHMRLKGSGNRWVVSMLRNSVGSSMPPRTALPKAASTAQYHVVVENWPLPDCPHPCSGTKPYSEWSRPSSPISSWTYSPKPLSVVEFASDRSIRRNALQVGK